jgi:CRISPR/Cas system-associated exonuclease Cas4 (RecB family)
MKPTSRVIRASEIGSFLYCRRAWWFRREGVVPENQADLASGNEFHQRHGRQVVAAGLLRTAGMILLLLALGLVAAGLVLTWIP